MTFKGVIFDFNGTLFWDGPKHELAWSQMAVQLRGTPFSNEDLKNYVHGQINRTIIHFLTEGKASDTKMLAYSKQKEAIYREMCRQDPSFLHLAPGAEALFDWLKTHQIPQSIATASIKENVDFFIQTFDLYRWFSPRCITFDDGINQNKLDMFNNAAHAMGLKISECVVFEDSISGINFAYEAGVGYIIAVVPACKHQEYSQLQGVNEVITDFNNINFHLFTEE